MIPDLAAEPLELHRPDAPLVGGSWFFRLTLFLAIVALTLSPAALVFPTVDAGGRFSQGLGAGIGFLIAAWFAHAGRSRASVAVAASTLLLDAILGALAPGQYAAEALGITVIAAVLVLPVTSRRALVPTLAVIGAVGSLAIGINRFQDASVLLTPASRIGSVWAAGAVLAVTLALVGWTHLRLMTALGEARRARADLDASETRYRMLIETAPDGILTVDPVTLQAQAANRRAAELFGYASAAEFLAAGPGPVFPDTQSDGRPTRDVAREVIEATIAGSPIVHQMVYRRRDGELFTAEVRTTMAETAGRTEVRLSLTDVSDRVAALHARDLTEARFRSLFASSPNAVLVVDGQGRIVDASDRAVEIFGHSADTLRHLGIEDLVPPLERDRHASLRHQLQDVRPDHHPVSPREVSGLRADGSLIPVEVGLSWFETAEGWFATAIVVDVTARRESERAVKDATETIRAIFDASPAGIAVIGLDGKVRLWNAAMERLTGFTAADAIGSADPSVPDERAGSRATILRAVAADGTVTGADLLLARSDETTFPAIGSFGPLHDATGAVVAIVSVVDDVSAMRSLEAQVNRKARLEAIGQLAGGIAHDINNVLTAIGGFASLSLDDLDAGLPVDREAIATIAEGAARTSALTRQLLAFARRDIRPAETMVLGDAVKAVEPMLRGLIGEHIALVIETGGNGHVRIAASQVEQLVINLVVNARDALPGGGTIRVDVETITMPDQSSGGRVGVVGGAYVALTVTDDGTGMPPEVAERVFDPFFTTKGPDEGTGLGLATVHGIVNEADGHVWLTSEVGVGTMFRIILPEVHPVAVGPGGPLDIAGRGHETVLIVEDEDVVRVLGTRVLVRAGFRVLTAVDADHALQVARDHEGPIHLLLTDVIMPRILGPDLARRVAELRPDTRVLFTSGYTAAGTGMGGSLPRDARFIDKPFSPSGLVDAVRATLDEPLPARPEVA